MLWLWILMSVIFIVVGVFALYELFWLNQSQVFMVYKKDLNLKEPNEPLIQYVEKETGAKLATQKDMDAEVKNGLNYCTAGVIRAGDGSNKTSYVVGYPTWVDADFKGKPSCIKTTPSATCPSSCSAPNTAGCVCGCGCNKTVNYGKFNDYVVPGYWLKGTRPTKLSDELTSKGWELAPFSAMRQNLGTTKVNKYEIFGIPKLF